MAEKSFAGTGEEEIHGAVLVSFACKENVRVCMTKHHANNEHVIYASFQPQVCKMNALVTALGSTAGVKLE